MVWTEERLTMLKQMRIAARMRREDALKVKRIERKNELIELGKKACIYELEQKAQ